MFIDKFFYASGYYYVKLDGTVVIKSNMPQDIKERFLKEWEEHIKEVKAHREKGIYDSRDIINFSAEPEFKIEYV
ncbi:MAG: hypothetical protein U0M15_05600 [Bacillota bacterium]|nr:hypothetical protein [Bacillota bacterium]